MLPSVGMGVCGARLWGCGGLTPCVLAAQLAPVGRTLSPVHGFGIGPQVPTCGPPLCVPFSGCHVPQPWGRAGGTPRGHIPDPLGGTLHSAAVPTGDKWLSSVPSTAQSMALEGTRRAMRIHLRT